MGVPRNDGKGDAFRNDGREDSGDDVGKALFYYSC